MKKSLVVTSLLLAHFFSFENLSALSCASLTSLLTKGSNGNEVLALQNFLVEKGHLTVKPSGFFGVSTVSAVREYQRSIGIKKLA